MNSEDLSLFFNGKFGYSSGVTLREMKDFLEYAKDNHKDTIRIASSIYENIKNQ